MIVNIYDELTWLRAEVERLGKLVLPKMELAVPSYFFPGLKWDLLLTKNPGHTIINPGNGPGTSPVAAYVTQVVKAKATGAHVFGYVYTQYGNRPVADVKLDVDRHFSFYAVTGIFFDQGANTLDKLQYYKQLYDYVKSKGGQVALNPGTRTIQEYTAAADHIMVAETDLATYRTRSDVPWEKTVSDCMFWHCVHTCPASNLPEVLGLARARNAGMLYVTDDVMPNPYDQLPTYLDALVGGL